MVEKKFVKHQESPPIKVWLYHIYQKENYDDDYIKIVLPEPVGPVHVSRYKRLEAEVKSKLQNFIAKGKSMQHGKNINEKYTILIFFQLATNSRSGQSGSARKSSTETFLSWIPRRSR